MSLSALEHGEFERRYAAAGIETHLFHLSLAKQGKAAPLPPPPIAHGLLLAPLAAAQPTPGQTRRISVPATARPPSATPNRHLAVQDIRLLSASTNPSRRPDRCFIPCYAMPCRSLSPHQTPSLRPFCSRLRSSVSGVSCPSISHPRL